MARVETKAGKRAEPAWASLAEMGRVLDADSGAEAWFRRKVAKSNPKLSDAAIDVYLACARAVGRSSNPAKTHRAILSSMKSRTGPALRGAGSSRERLEVAVREAAREHGVSVERMKSAIVRAATDGRRALLVGSPTACAEASTAPGLFPAADSGGRGTTTERDAMDAEFHAHVQRLGHKRVREVMDRTLTPKRRREIDALVAAKEAAFQRAVRSVCGGSRPRPAAPAESKSTGARRASPRHGAA